MERALSRVVECLCCISDPGDEVQDEKRALLDYRKVSPNAIGPAMPETMPYFDSPDMTLEAAAREMRSEETANNIVKILVQWKPSSGGRPLKYRLKDEVDAYGWWDEWLATKMFDKLLDILQKNDTNSWGDNFREVFAKAKKAADDVITWVEDHPETIAVAIACVIVLGILVLTCPWLIELLGFGARGPSAGKKGSGLRTVS